MVGAEEFMLYRKKFELELHLSNIVNILPSQLQGWFSAGQMDILIL